LCTESTLPVLSLKARAAREKNWFARSSTVSGCSTSDSRVKLRSSAKRMAAGRRSGFCAMGVSGGGDAVQVMLPDVQVALARGDRGVFHASFLGDFLPRPPAGVGVLDVGLGVQLEEFQFFILQMKQIPPPAPFDAEPAAPAELALAVARHVDAL